MSQKQLNMVVNIRLPFAFVFLMFLLVQSEAHFEEYFYWRHFNGSIPVDAVPGGTTPYGDKTFIGSTLFNPSVLLPSTIYRNDRYAYGHAGGSELKSDKVTKILCAKPDKHPVWKQVDINSLPSNCYFIEGGWEMGYPLYIGRVNIKGVYYTGKVFPASRPNFNGLEVFTDRFVPKIKQFKILAYCPSETPATRHVSDIVLH